MAAPYGVTDPWLRDVIESQGGDPNDPAQRARFEQAGVYAGEAPAGGLSGFLGAAASGFGRELENLGRGVVDLPLAVGRGLGVTNFRVDARQPGPLEQANPIGSGLGGLGGTLASFLVPEALIGRLGAVQKLRTLGAMSEAGLGAGRASRALVDAAGGLGAVEANAGLRALLEARTGRTLFRPTVWSGFRLPAMTARAVPAAGAFAAQEFLKPGDIEERVGRAWEGAQAGALLGALGAPAGLRRLPAMAREAVAATVAFGGHPILDDERVNAALPGPVQTAIFGGLAGIFRGKGVPKDVPSQLRPDWMGLKPERLRPDSPPLAVILDRITDDVQRGVTPQAVYDELKRQGIFRALVQTRRRAFNEPALEFAGESGFEGRVPETFAAARAPAQRPTPAGAAYPEPRRRPADDRALLGYPRLGAGRRGFEGVEYGRPEVLSPTSTRDLRAVRPGLPSGSILTRGRAPEPPALLDAQGRSASIQPLVLRDAAGRVVRGLIVPGGESVRPDTGVVWRSETPDPRYTPTGPLVGPRGQPLEPKPLPEPLPSDPFTVLGPTVPARERATREAQADILARRDIASEVILRDVHTKAREGVLEAVQEAGGGQAIREPQKITRASQAAVERRVEDLIEKGWDPTDARVQAQDELSGRRPRWDGTPETLTPPEVPRVVEQPPQPQFVAGAQKPEGYYGPEGKPLGGDSLEVDSPPPPQGPSGGEKPGGGVPPAPSPPASPPPGGPAAGPSGTLPAPAPTPPVSAWDRALDFLKPYKSKESFSSKLVADTAQMSPAERALFREVLRGMSGGALKKTYTALDLNTALFKLKMAKEAPASSKSVSSLQPEVAVKPTAPKSAVPNEMVTPRDVFRSKGSGHEKWDDAWQKMVEDGVLEPAHVDLLHEIFRDTDDAWLTKVEMASKELPEKQGGETLSTTAKETGADQIGEGGFSSATISLNSLPQPFNRVAVLLHEVGHAGYWGLLTDAERALVHRVFAEAQARIDLRAHMGSGLVTNPRALEHVSKTPREFFAQSFADWVVKKKALQSARDKALNNVFLKVFDKIINAVKRLVLRKEPAELADLEPLFEIILGGKNAPTTAPKSGPLSVFKEFFEEPDGAPLKPEPGPPPLGVIPPRETWFGLPRIDKAIWHALSLSDAYQHTLARMRDLKNTNWGRYGGLFRYALKVQRSGQSTPVLDAILASKASTRGLLLQRGEREAFKAADKEGVMYVPARGVVRDKASGLEIPADTSEEAVLAAHTMLSLRRRASELGVPLTPDIGLDMGPHAPTYVPLADIDGSAGELHSQLPPNPEARSFTAHRNLRWGPIQRWFHTHLSSGESFFNSLGEAIKRTTGEDHPLIRLARDAQGLALKADRIVRDVLEGTSNVWKGQSLANIARDEGVQITDEVGNTIGQFAQMVDTRMETIRKQIVGGVKRELEDGTPNPAYEAKAKEAQAAQASLLDTVVDQVRAEMPHVSDAEVRFFRRALDEWWTPLYDYLGLDPLEFRFGFFHRLNTESATRTFGFRAEDPTRVDPTLARFKGALLRLREDPGLAADPTLENLLREAAEHDAWFVETLKNETSYWEVASAYARRGIRRKLVGDHLDEMRKTVTMVDRPTGGLDAGILIHGFVEGNIWAQRDVADRLKREITNLMGFPDSQTMKTGQRVRQNRIALIRNLARAANWLEKHDLPAPLVSSLRSFYRHMGIQLTNGQVQSIGTAYARLHRAQTFGFNLMAVARDMVSTDIMTAQRLPARYFGPEWVRLRLNPLEMVKEYRRLRSLDRIDDIQNQISTPQLEEAVRLRPSLRTLWEAMRSDGPMPRVGLSTVFDLADAIQILYKLSDTGTKILVHSATERAVRAEFAKLKRSAVTERDLDEFVLNTGLAYAQSFDVRTLRNQLRQSVKDGTANLDSLIEKIANINIEETAFTFHRIHSAPLMDSTPGRVFLFYGSWPLRALAAQYHQATGPLKNLSDPGYRAKAYAKTVTRFALASGAAYSIGASLNVDTSDWIPFLHNSIPAGGPGVTLIQNAREILSGDPSMMQRLQKDPMGMAFVLGRQTLPGIPTVFRRAYSQMAESPSKRVRLAWSLPPQQADVWDRFSVSLGFNPYQRPLYPAFRRGGLPSLALEQTVGRFQDWVASWAGLPPGTIQGAAGWTPPLKPR